MVQTYKVTKVSSAVKDVPLDHGTFKSYRFYCEGHGETVFSVLQKPETAPPAPGDTFEATVKNIFQNDDGTSVTNLKKVQQQGRNGGNDGSYSPEVQARIDAVGRVKGRCHAQQVAATILTASGDIAVVDFGDPEQAGAFLNHTFKPLVTWLVKDANTARNQEG